LYIVRFLSLNGSYDGWFVDLFVRASNVAIKMYEKLGYVVYRRVKDYYQDEDGLGM
jgi:N-terminal acetyltransferase B complex catalytic subunit